MCHQRLTQLGHQVERVRRVAVRFATPTFLGDRLEVVVDDEILTLVVEAKGVSFARGDRTIVRDFSTRIARGDRVEIELPMRTTLERLPKELKVSLLFDQSLFVRAA